ncbi:TetR/AcrR family transcriptional regulator [Streptomyces beijiangensis]|uniref:TetR family transcriptional regulator n=1 Tax=Streptomyces beijiangensis TaxID=163361 RepID=A0A939JM74_9ACTN|nr:TetR family transcriptional regulator [Streptomyces beijiangensis]MBO0516484.1 TetR family transcriptional regulator [Streptomyces beijiangensis]
MESSTAPGQPMPSTRQLLIEVAQQEVFDRGYHGASLRSIARRAGVDPSLVRHYFGSKEKLLLQAVQVRTDPRELAAEVLRGTPGGVGRRLVKFMLAFWEGPSAAESLVRLSASLNSGEVADLTKDAFIGPLFGTIAQEISPDQPELRAALAASQVLALAYSRYLLDDPALAGAGHQDLARIVGRAVQQYLTEPLPEPLPAAEAA